MTAEVIPLNPENPIPHQLMQVEPVKSVVSELTSETPYDINRLLQIEEKMQHVILSLPARKSPYIQDILSMIQEIVGDTSIESIRSFLHNTAENSPRARADLQRCGAVLQKIGAIHSKQGVNWNLIFSRLNLEEKQAA